MPGIADMLVQGAQAQSQTGPDLTGAISQGSQLAQHMENIQQQRQALELQKQQVYQQKFSKVGDWFEQASKMPDGSAKQAFVNEFIPKGISALGLEKDIDPTSLKMMKGDPNLAAYLKAQVQDGKIAFSDLLEAQKNPEVMAKFLPLAKQWGDQQNFQDTVQANVGGLAEAHKFATSEEGKLARSTLLGGARQQQAQTGVDRLNYDVHQKAINSIEKDSTVKNLLQTKQNLDNAISNFTKGGATVQEFHELQQAVRSNVGIKGGSGIDERAATYLKGLGLNADLVQQFLTGEPQSVLESNPAFAKQIIGVAGLELANKKAQAEKLIDTKAKAYQKFYQKNPELKSNYEDFKNSYKDQFNSPNLPEATFNIGGREAPISQAKAFYQAHPERAARLTKEQKKALGL